MDLNYNLYLERANNEIKFADIALFVSNNKKIQTDVMKIEEPETYYIVKDIKFLPFSYVFSLIPKA